jgi:hypothetical protein
MATGIVKRHARGCRSRNDAKCACEPSYEAWVSVKKDGRHTKVRKTFRREAEAKSWRGDAIAATNRGKLRPVRRDESAQSGFASTKAKERPRRGPGPLRGTGRRDMCLCFLGEGRRYVGHCGRPKACDMKLQASARPVCEGGHRPVER